MAPLDFVIIGLPKAGTSSLYNWLAEHPEIQGSTPKETFFFMDQDHPLARSNHNYNIQGLSAFDQFFPAPKNNRFRFEATTHYFYQQTAIDFFTKMNPKLQVFVCLRNPSERIHSSFRFTRENLANMDRNLTFNMYVDYLLEHRVVKLKDYFYSEGSFHIACKELELNRYVEWLDKWNKRLYPDQLYLLSFDAMKNHPKMVMKQLCNKLGVDDRFYDNYGFTAKNRTLAIKNQRLHRLARNWGSKIPTGNIKSKMKSLYFQLQQPQADDVPDTWSEGLKQLNQYFETWNEQLARNYGIDLN